MPRKNAAKEVDPMQTLARIALEEQGEKMKERERKRISTAEALKQQRQTEQEQKRKLDALAGVCDHLLGNHRRGVIPDVKRTALHMDHLSNKRVRIYCSKPHGCRFEWRPGDTKEHIFRPKIEPDGELVKLPNPSNTSWREIRDKFFSFPNANELISRAFRMERMEPEDFEGEQERAAAAVSS